MSFGYCHLSVIPLRETANDTSQMVSQLLFGDVFEIIEQVSAHWIKIKNAFDSYEGYIDAKQCIVVDEETYHQYQNSGIVNSTAIAVNGNFGSIFLPPACQVQENSYQVGNWKFEAIENIKKEDCCIRNEVVKVAKSYLNAPYLWGGKTPFGIDCSGFTQSVYKIAGIPLWRDASQQAKQGEVLSFIEEAQPGDLAFFDNEEGNIIHVGIFISNNEMIHASGRVRIDKIDHVGIFNEETGSYSHKLRLIKEYISQG